MWSKTTMLESKDELLKNYHLSKTLSKVMLELYEKTVNSKSVTKFWKVIKHEGDYFRLKKHKYDCWHVKANIFYQPIITIAKFEWFILHFTSFQCACVFKLNNLCDIVLLFDPAVKQQHFFIWCPGLKLKRANRTSSAEKERLEKHKPSTFTAMRKSYQLMLVWHNSNLSGSVYLAESKLLLALPLFCFVGVCTPTRTKNNRCFVRQTCFSLGLNQDHMIANKILRIPRTKSANDLKKGPKLTDKTLKWYVKTFTAVCDTNK